MFYAIGGSNSNDDAHCDLLGWQRVDMHVCTVSEEHTANIFFRLDKDSVYRPISKTLVPTGNSTWCQDLEDHRGLLTAESLRNTALKNRDQCWAIMKSETYGFAFLKRYKFLNELSAKLVVKKCGEIFVS
jgi:hypothetical protein